MTLLQVIDFHHRWQPRLARRGVRRGALVLETGQVVTLEAVNPCVDGRTGDVQKPTDTAFAPALEVELNDLHTGLGTLRIAVVVEQGQLLGCGGWQLLPELLHAMVTEAAGACMKKDPDQFSVPE